MARAIKDGLVKREELFIVSKLWNTYHDADKVESIARKQLADLQIDYFDLYLIHFPVALKYVDPAEAYPPGWNHPATGKPEFSNATIQETWAAMESLVDKKLARSIGISNFSVQLIMDLLRYARIPPATLQIEHHPYLQQKKLVEFVQKQGIVITAYSSFGNQGFLELDMEAARNVPLLFDVDVIKAAAAKHGKTPAQVLLRWATQRGIAVIPKSSNPKRLAENLDVTGWDLDDSEIEAINALDKGIRFNDPLNVRIRFPVPESDTNSRSMACTFPSLPKSAGITICFEYLEMMNDVISSTIGYDTVAIDYRLPANTLFSQKTLGTASPSVILRRMRYGLLQGARTVS